MAAPERTCVGCRARVPKHALMRVARASDGAALVDPAGSAPGRGAYVHLDTGCIGTAMRSRAFDRALRTRLTTDAADRLGNALERTMGAM